MNNSPYSKTCPRCSKDMGRWDRMGLPCPCKERDKNIERKKSNSQPSPKANQRETERASHKAYIDAKFEEIWEYKGEVAENKEDKLPDILRSLTDGYFAHLKEKELTQQTAPKFEVAWSNVIGIAQRPYKIKKPGRR